MNEFIGFYIFKEDSSSALAGKYLDVRRQPHETKKNWPIRSTSLFFSTSYGKKYVSKIGE